MAFRLLPATCVIWLPFCCSVQATSASNGPTVWKGPDLTVTQPNDQFDTVTDVFIPGVASLGRGFSGSLCNTAVSDVCSAPSMIIPSDFEFAFSNLNGNPTIPYGSAEQFASFTFANFITSVDRPSSNLPPGVAGSVPGVGRIVSADVYFDIEILNWQSGRGGGFSYRRSTLPEPTTLLLAAVGICLSLGRRRKIT